MAGDKRSRLKRWLGLGLAVLLLTVGQTAAAADAQRDERSPKLEVHFLDVGQGDATLIMTEGHSMLIDAGNNSKGTAVWSYLKNQGIENLDYVIGTHPDADHAGGLDVILYKFDCGRVLLPDLRKDTKTWEDVENTIKAKNYQAQAPRPGDSYQLGDAKFTVLAPQDKAYEGSNDYSIALRLDYGSNRFLFVGDAEEESENEMLEREEFLSADVYKVSHHGSRTGTSEEFLKAVSPEYAVISCGEDNAYGHPHAEVLNLLRSKGIKVFRTDEQGTIVATSDGEKITWNMSPDSSWKAGEAEGSQAREQARGRGKGKDAGDVYILNTNSMKVHKPSCASAKKIAGRNRKESDDSLSQLKKQGYTPCANCMKK